MPQDLEKMSPEQMRWYIFGDTRFEGRPRFTWITDCLLGDIRTFLDGIEKATGTNQKIAGNLPRGGGNLSVPILISTALEFIAELYAGNTKYMRLSRIEMNEGLEKEWKKFEDQIHTEKERFRIDNLVDEVKEIIKRENLPINRSAKIASVSKKVIVIDRYQIIKEKESGKLNIYENYNATDNVIRFIKDFFPKQYQKIPRIFWDGVRNGLVHTFYPKLFTYPDNANSSSGSLQFDFYVEPPNFPSKIKKDNNKILIRINVFELYRVLEKAIDDYCDKLKHTEKLQKKFIKAWKSIEEYKDPADDLQSKEIKKLREYLKPNTTVPVLECLKKEPDLQGIYSLRVRRF